MCYQDCLQETTVSRMWQCEDSHSSTHAQIADLLGQSLPVRVSRGKKSDGLGVKVVTYTPWQAGMS